MSKATGGYRRCGAPLTTKRCPYLLACKKIGYAWISVFRAACKCLYLASPGHVNEPHDESQAFSSYNNTRKVDSDTSPAAHEISEHFCQSRSCAIVRRSFVISRVSLRHIRYCLTPSSYPISECKQTTPISLPPLPTLPYWSTK